ncbi:MAG: hypothetical protein ACLQE9_13165 [Roseiarcus sp.]
MRHLDEIFVWTLAKVGAGAIQADDAGLRLMAPYEIPFPEASASLFRPRIPAEAGELS